MATISQAFDPYHKWLGIRDSQHPPNHYRLLALEAFEDDADVIRDAAGRAIAHVRSFRAGPHKELAQQIINELSVAKSTLLDFQEKSAYDRWLRTQLKPAGGASHVAAASPAQHATAIRCTKCKRENPPGRAFCGGCGSSLAEPCIACGASIGADDKHCGLCGVNVHLATEQRINQLKAKLADAQQHRKTGRPADALLLLEEIAAVEHPRLAEFKHQAQPLVEQLKAEISGFQQQSGAKLRLAQLHFDRSDYDQAALVIEEVPEAFRTPEMKDLLAQTHARQLEVISLLAEIRQRVAAKQLDGLLAKVERLLELKPDHPQAQSLLERLRPLEQKRLEQQRDQLCKAALQQIEQHDYERAVHFLDQIPKEVVTPQIAKLIEQTHAKAAEVDWLRRNLREAVAFDPHLPAIAERLLKLVPSDQEARTFVEQIEQLRSPQKASGSQLNWPAPPEVSYWKFPLHTISRFHRLQYDLAAVPDLAQQPGSFAVAIGLALQGIGQAQLETNLLPEGSGMLSKLKRVTRRTSASTAWGIDLGRSALKAVQLSIANDGRVIVERAAYIEHERVLNRADVSGVSQVMGATLAKLWEHHPQKGAFICASMPSHRVLPRFFRLPMMETRKVAEVMRFEVQQQMPFPIEQVHWDWQILNRNGASNDVREHDVALFVAKNDDLNSYVGLLNEVGLRVDILQSDSVALQNCMAFELAACDANSDPSQVTALLDVGTDGSNLITSGPQTLWMRSMAVGSSHFTRAIVKQFAITTAQAEILKRKPTAAREMNRLYDALQPVFTDFITELQRSIEAFQQTDRTKQIARMFVLGGGIHLHGLLKALWLGR